MPFLIRYPKWNAKLSNANIICSSSSCNIASISLIARPPANILSLFCNLPLTCRRPKLRLNSTICSSCCSRSSSQSMEYSCKCLLASAASHSFCSFSNVDPPPPCLLPTYQRESTRQGIKRLNCGMCSSLTTEEQKTGEV